jgi:hypothetical protein
MTTPSRKFEEKEIRRILQVASSHEDRRAGASTSLLLSLSVPLYVQEYFLWKNLTLVTGWTSINMNARLLKLELPFGSASAKHLSKLRAASRGPRVFTKPAPDSPSLRQLNEDLLVRAKVFDCSHKDLLQWSRRQTPASRRSFWG